MAGCGGGGGGGDNTPAPINRGMVMECPGGGPPVAVGETCPENAVRKDCGNDVTVAPDEDCPVAMKRCSNNLMVPITETCPVIPRALFPEANSPPLAFRTCAHPDVPPGRTPAELELRNQCPILQTNIVAAHEDYTGAGVTVGILDDFLDTRHIEFQDSLNRFNDVDNGPTVMVSEAGTDYSFTVSPSALRHGVNVAGVIAAKRDGAERSFNMYGIAYESNIVFRGISGIIVFPQGQTNPDNLNSYREIRIAVGAELLKEFVAADVPIVSRSQAFLPPGVGTSLTGGDFGRCGDPQVLPADNPCSIFDTAAFTQTQLEANGLNRIAEAMLQTGKAAADRTIFVNAAGNYHRANPDIDAGLTHQYEGLRGHHVTVVAVERNGEIADFSNRCGVVAAYCIAAPGAGIVVPAFGNDIDVSLSWVGEQIRDGYGVADGTSFAAPIVAGALALLFEAFGDQLGADAILERLYDSANDEGIYADTAIYGQGLLDIGAAVAPLGNTELRTSFGRQGARVHEATPFDTGTSGVFLSHAFGDAVSRALGSRETVFFDELNTAFAFPARELFHTNTVYDPFRRLRRAARAEISVISGHNATLSFSLGYDARVNDYFGLVRDGPSLSMQLDVSDTQSIRASFFMGRQRETQSLTEETPADTYGAHIAYGVSLARLFLELEAGYLMEADQILGAYPQGAFAHEGKTPTFFAGVAGTYALADGWEGRVHARMGHTKPDALGVAHTGLHDITRLTSSAFSAGLYRRNLFAWGDALGFIVAQPLRIEEGSAEFTYAIGRSRGGLLLEETLDIPLAPSGRALDLRLVYEGANMVVSTGATLNARHEAGRTDAHIAVRLFKRF